MEHQEIKSNVGKKASVIWQAYQEVLAELKKKDEAASTTAVAASKRKAHAIATAEKVNVDDIGDSVEGLVSGLQEAKATFLDLKEAIEAKKKELKEVHDLEVEVNSMVAVVAAKEKLVKDSEQRAKEALDLVEVKTAEMIKDSNEEAAKILMASKVKFKEDEASRDRIQSEWEYSFARTKKARKDELQDEIDAEQKKLAQQIAELELREAKQAELEGEVEALKKRLVENENATTDLIEVAVAKAKASADKSFNFQKQLIEKHYESRVGILESEKSSLETQLANITIRLDRADTQVQAANDKVTSIATGALQAAGDKATIAKVSEIAAGSQHKGK